MRDCNGYTKSKRPRRKNVCRSGAEGKGKMIKLTRAQVGLWNYVGAVPFPCKREPGEPMFKLAVALALLCAAHSSGLAQTGRQGTSEEQQACSRDASRLCRKQLGDDAAVQQCLHENRTKLSESCQNYSTASKKPAGVNRGPK